MNNKQKQIIEKIKTRGYWKVTIEPIYQTERFFDHMIEAKKVVEENRIQLRGWDYPHYPTKDDDNEGFSLSPKQLDSFIDWDYFKESWTYYNSGQFVHIFGLREDWYEEGNFFGSDDRLKKISPKSMLDFVGAILTITEIFMFTLNLMSNSKYKGKVILKISLNNTDGRSVETLDWRRSIWGGYKATTDNIDFHEKEYFLEDLKDNYLIYARKTAIDLFKYFGWNDPSEAVIEQDQKNFLERKI